MSESLHICKQSLFKTIPNLSELSWKFNNISVIMKLDETFDSMRDHMLNRILQYIDCKLCANTLINITNMYGQNGPILANYHNDNTILCNKEIFSELYDKSMSNFKRIFVDNHIDSIHTIIQPMLCCTSDETKHFNKESSLNYWIPFHNVLISITTNWNMAGKCHSTRQFYRTIISILHTMKSCYHQLIETTIIMDNILKKFCIPFEHVNITNRITISIDGIEELYNKNICIDKFIETNIHIHKIILAKFSKNIILQKLTELGENIV